MKNLPFLLLGRSSTSAFSALCKFPSKPVYDM